MMLNKIIGIIQARMGSSRLPNKVLMDIEGEPLLGHIISRSKAIGLLEIIVATSTNPADSAIVDLAKCYKVKSFRGSEEDVLSRFVGAIEGLKIETLLRITGDNPLIDPKITKEIILRHIDNSSDYTVMEGLPLGISPEVVSKKAILMADDLLDKDSIHREHVTSFIRKRNDLFKVQILEAPSHLKRPNWRLTVDTYEDLVLIRTIFANLLRPGRMICLADVIRLLDTNPKLLEINGHIRQRVLDA